MRILAIETVETNGTVALLEGERVLVERELDPQQRSAQSLAPGIAAALEAQNWDSHDVDLVAVTTGPGSFTGLRIGVTTAKTLAYAIGCPLVGVNSLLAIAWRAPRELKQLTAVIDAQRGELFVADFVRGDDGTLSGEQTTRLETAAWLDSLSPDRVLTGPGLHKHQDRLVGRVTLVDEALWAPRAAAVGQIGARLFAAGQHSKPFDLLPQYFRRTAAEEQWERKQAK